MSEAKPFPIDFDELERGSIIPASAIESWRGHKPGTNEYRVDAMQLAQRVRDHFEDNRGDVVSVRMRGDTIAVLTHVEQNEYVPSAQRAALRAFARRHVEDQGIDPAQLSLDDQKRREARLVRSSWLLQQSRKRSVPQLGPGKKE